MRKQLMLQFISAYRQSRLNEATCFWWFTSGNNIAALRSVRRKKTLYDIVIRYMHILQINKKHIIPLQINFAYVILHFFELLLLFSASDNSLSKVHASSPAVWYYWLTSYSNFYSNTWSSFFTLLVAGCCWTTKQVANKWLDHQDIRFCPRVCHFVFSCVIDITQYYSISLYIVCQFNGLIDMHHYLTWYLTLLKKCSFYTELSQNGDKRRIHKLCVNNYLGTQPFVPFDGLPKTCPCGWPPLIQLVAYQFCRFLGGQQEVTPYSTCVPTSSHLGCLPSCPPFRTSGYVYPIFVSQHLLAVT